MQKGLDMPDLTSFPRNDAGEPLMSGEAWRYEQSLDAEPDYEEYEDPYEYDPEDYNYE